MTRLETRALNLTIGGKTICHDLSVAFQAGQNWAILGANGSGKTTLLHTLAGLRPPAAGQIFLDGSAIGTFAPRALAQRRGVLFQDSEAPFASGVMETVLSGRHPHLSPWQWEDAHDLGLAAQALNDMEMGAYTNRLLTTLSGGERRRVDIAALLTQDAPMCLLDEPLNHLDLNHQIKVLGLLQRRGLQPGHLNIMVLHDANLALRYCSHGLLLFGAGVCRHGPLDGLLDPPTLEQLYGCRFRKLTDAAGSAYFPA